MLGHCITYDKYQSEMHWNYITDDKHSLCNALEYNSL